MSDFESLFDEAVARLEEDKGEWPTTARETGLDYNWISKLSNSGIDDPGVKKIEKLVNYLREKQAQVA